MTKEEFLNLLRECLDGVVSPQEISDTILYYREYFAEQERNGLSESEIIASLGSPRLIAHSIADAHEESVSGTSGYYDPEEDRYQEEGEITVKDQMRYLASKAGVILGVIAILVVAAALLHVLMPVIVVAIVFIFVSNLIRRK